MEQQKQKALLEAFMVSLNERLGKVKSCDVGLLEDINTLTQKHNVEKLENGITHFARAHQSMIEETTLIEKILPYLEKLKNLYCSGGSFYEQVNGYEYPISSLYYVEFVCNSNTESFPRNGSIADINYSKKDDELSIYSEGMFYLKFFFTDKKIVLTDTEQGFTLMVSYKDLYDQTSFQLVSCTFLFRYPQLYGLFSKVNEQFFDSSKERELLETNPETRSKFLYHLIFRTKYFDRLLS